MRQIQGHYGGSTWAGATRPVGLPLAADAALVAPTHVLPEAKARTKTGTSLRSSECLSRTEDGIEPGRDCGRKGNLR